MQGEEEVRASQLLRVCEGGDCGDDGTDAGVTAHAYSAGSGDRDNNKSGGGGEVKRRKVKKGEAV